MATQRLLNDGRQHEVGFDRFVFRENLHRFLQRLLGERFECEAVGFLEELPEKPPDLLCTRFGVGNGSEGRADFLDGADAHFVPVKEVALKAAERFQRRGSLAPFVRNCVNDRFEDGEPDVVLLLLRLRLVALLEEVVNFG